METSSLKLILAVFLLFLVPTVSAIDSNTVTLTVPDLGNFPQGSCVRIIQICSNCTYNNVTSILLPNSTAIYPNVGMTKSGFEYNASFCNTFDFGRYIVNGVGDINGVPQIWVYSFGVGTGSLIVLLVILFGGLFILGIALFLDNEYLGFIAGCMFIVGGVYLIINGVSQIGDDYTRMTSFVLIGIGIMFNIAVGYSIFSPGETEE